MAQLRNKKLLKKVSLRIKELRDASNITQEDFYNDTGINIGRIERAVNDLSISTLSRICEYFDISIQEFFSKVK
jgi:transcriptional regulator with XRE-family HTH domain